MSYTTSAAEAGAAGARLLDLLTKESVDTHWRLDVWENLGWHYGARLQGTSGCLSVYPSEYNGAVYSYTAYLGFDSGAGLWTGSGKTPDEAIKEVLEIAERELDKKRALVSSVQVAYHREVYGKGGTYDRT